MTTDEVTVKFEFWAAPICDQSYGNVKATDVLEYLKNTTLAEFRGQDDPEQKSKKLSSIILPLVNGGHQPIGPTGPIERFRTKTRKWESNSEEFQLLKRLLFGQGREPVPEPPPKTEIIRKQELEIQ